ncbi:MAG: sulfite exporter TauE/SafE family protein [Eubacteriales bacterium]|nr:sulfite exporter TauE/SafE family protein [Eubacteriales bacterium]
MRVLLYFLIAICATTVGSLTGMGGGVIIKPALDLLGGYDAATIGILSSVTVFAMAIVSIAKQLRQKTPIPVKTALPLAVGSVVGGTGGERILKAVIAALGDNRAVVMTQNICLGLLIAAVFLYMLKKDKLPTLHRGGFLLSVLAGVLLGFFSSFLGIGGGPINVALLIFVFSMDTKTATVCSIITILFAQISKLASVALATGFAPFNLTMLPVMIIGAVAGGWLGAKLNKQLPEKTVEKAFNCVQLVVLTVCVFNICRNL